MGICLKDVGIVCNIGQSKQTVLKSLIDGNANALIKDDKFTFNRTSICWPCCAEFR